MRTNSQTARVFNRLRRGQLVTASYGRNKMGIDHVGRQIYSLRKAGHNIVSETIPSKKQGKPRVKYSLVG